MSILMSIEIMTWVWKHSAASGSYLLTLLAIADYANGDTGDAFPAVRTLAAKTRLSERSVQRITQDLEASGALHITRSKGPGRSNRYQIVTMGDTLSGDAGDGMVKGDAGDAEGVTPVAAMGDTPQATNRHITVTPEPSEKVTPTAAASGVTPKHKPERVEVDEPFREKMRQRYGGKLEHIDQRIDEALNHANARKYTNMQLYVNGWLRRDHERMPRQPATRGAVQTAEAHKAAWGNQT